MHWLIENLVLPALPRPVSAPASGACGGPLPYAERLAALVVLATLLATLFA